MWLFFCREELEKQQARARYNALHIAGKTDEARADLARLAIIRQQREEVARKKELTKKEEEESKKGWFYFFILSRVCEKD